MINAEGTDIAVSRREHVEWVDSQYNAEKILEEKEDPVTRSIIELERNGLDGKSGRGTYCWEDGLCYLFYAPIPYADRLCPCFHIYGTVIFFPEPFACFFCMYSRSKQGRSLGTTASPNV